MTAAAPQYPQTPMLQAHPPRPGPTKEEPWGSEDPLMWCARKVRRLTLMSSASIAFLILLFGAGMYTLFTIVIYEGEEQLEGEGAGGLILLLITPLALAITGGIMTAILAKNVGRLAEQPGAPSGAPKAKLILWLSAALWFFLFIVFFIAILTTAEGGEEGSDGDFPVGLLTILPVYMGLCLAVFTSGAALAAASEENRLESFLVLGLGWAAFVVFLILPALLSSWNIGSGNETIDWDSVIFWLRFGNLFPAVLPWLIVLALNWTHVRSIDILEASGTAPSVTTFAAVSNGSRAMVATGAGEPFQSIRGPKRCSAPHAAQDWPRRRSSSMQNLPAICSWSSRNLPDRPWNQHQRKLFLPRSRALFMPIPMLARSAGASSPPSPCPSSCTAPRVVLASQEVEPNSPLNLSNRRLQLNLFNRRLRPSRSNHHREHKHHRLLSLHRRYLRQSLGPRGSARTVGAP